MSKKSDKHIKNIISQVEIDKAPLDFTSKVMQDVFVSSKEESLKDAVLSSLLKRTNFEMPSQDFVSSIMDQVETPIDFKYQPLISKKTWVIISAFFVGLIIVAFLIDTPKESAASITKASLYLSSMTNLFSNAIKELTESPLLIISIFSLSILLLVDTYFKGKIIR